MLVTIWTPTFFSFVIKCFFVCLSYLILKCILQSIQHYIGHLIEKIKTRQVCMQISSGSMAA